MGNSSSSTRESRLADERAYIRSLGDRYPLGDAELRKWCFCNAKLASSEPPLVAQSLPSASLASLAAWSAVYGDYNPYSRLSQSQLQSNNRNPPFVRRVDAAARVSEAVANVERHILPPGLGAAIVRHALKFTQTPSDCKQQSSANDPVLSTKGMTIDEVSSFEESYYSISSSVAQYLASRDASPYGNASESQSLEDFLEGVSTSCGRRGSRASLSKLFAIASFCDGCNAKPGMSTRVEASKVIRTAYCLALAASYLRDTAAKRNNNTVRWEDFARQSDPEVMQSMVDSLLESATKQRREGGGAGNFGFDYSYPTTNATPASSADDNTITLEEFLEWTETTNLTMMSSALPTFLHVLFTFFTPPGTGDGSEPRFPPGVTPLWIPTLTIERPVRSTHTSPTSSFFPDPTSSSFDLFALSCTSLSLASGRWHRLFSSEANGLSCNRLMHSVLGYGGPTIILIRSKGASVFGAYTATPWKESADFYGNSECFLFRLGPDTMSVYPAKGGSSSAQYFNPESRSKGYDGLAHGIGFGGSSESPRLFIDEVIDNCQAASEDLAFEKGPLLSGLPSSSSSSHFEVEAMEAWGVGTSELVEEALLARDGQRQDREKEIRKIMKGAKGQFLDDMQRGLHGTKVFKHREEMTARDGPACDLERDEE
ncbi:hypothetical protein ACHAXT_009933 [Thalassiosira profunda]